VAEVSSGSTGVMTSVSLTRPYWGISCWVANEGAPLQTGSAKLRVAMPA
jgi:hypothetical protein